MDAKEFLLSFPYLFEAAKEEVRKARTEEENAQQVKNAEDRREVRRARNLKNKANGGF